MTTQLADSIHHALDQLASGTIAVAYSGGMDSTVLLHALAHLPSVRERGLRAVHVDHGMHAQSTKWSEHCRTFSESLGVEFLSLRVTVSNDGGGPEDSARRARYAAYAKAQHRGEVLALAHHADDQAETILLKLMRGAGPEGLGGMRSLRPFGHGSLWRPLLGVSRSELASYAREHALRWIEDPSNADTRLGRNFLRAEILPRLRQRWPDALDALSHSATWARAAADYLDAEAQRHLTLIRGADPSTIKWQDWLQLADALRDPVLRLWLRELHFSPPAHFHVAELERQLREAGADRTPCVSWGGVELRRYRDLVYAMAPIEPIATTWEHTWNGERVDLPGGGTLALRIHSDCSIPHADVPLAIRFRRGGERIKPAGSSHHRDLRLLLQESGIPPWKRARIPLIYAGSELVAAGDLFVSAAGAELLARLNARIEWTQAAPGIDS